MISVWRIIALVLILTIIGIWAYDNRSSHYQVLGVQKAATFQEISSAYGSKSAGLIDHGHRSKIEIAFEVLSDELRRRDYDNFEYDEPQGGSLVSEGFPESITVNLGAHNFASVIGSNQTWLIQIYSAASAKSREFSPIWEKLAKSLEGVNLGRVELGEELVKLLVKRSWASRRPIFRNGLPEILAFPATCQRLDCVMLYSKELTYEAVLDWTATKVLTLPRVMYYSSQNLMTDMIQKQGPHKVKALFFSETGERALPYMRQAAKDYSQFVSFGCVLWRQHEAHIWQSRLGVESAPALVFLKDPATHPVVYHGQMNRSVFLSLLEEHKNHELPQLRSVNAEELGCDAAGYSAAGKDVRTWYCVIAAGKPGYQLDKLRAVMRQVQSDVKIDENSNPSVAATAYKQKRLRITWLDGAIQKDFCYSLAASENVRDTCGPRQYAEEEDVPLIFLIRFHRQDEENQTLTTNKKHKNLWEQVLTADENLASILIAKYNGSNEASEIISWISHTVHNGDTENIPNFKLKSAPVLIPEESPSMMSRTQGFAGATLENFGNFWKDVMVELVDRKLFVTILAGVGLCVIGLWKSS